MSNKKDDRNKLYAELSELKKRVYLQENLPHLYGYRFYKWQRSFLSSRNKRCFITAANQIGKSTIQWLKVIMLATEPDLWPLYFTRRPKTFWYLYPNYKTSTEEYFEKLVPYILPKGEFKDGSKYGWSDGFRGKDIYKIMFKSGVTIYLKTYNQDSSDLQAGTVDYIACDEELPVEHYNELVARLADTEGLFSMVFTATLGQDFWRETMEEHGTKEERFIGADKWQISLYDCLEFEDGTPSRWTLDRIERRKEECSSDAEVQRRIFGKFAVDSDLMFPTFTKEVVVSNMKIPSDYYIYSGVDYGSGGTSGHPSAIAFLAVSRDFKSGYVFTGWRGDGVTTTAGDLFEKYMQLRGNMKVCCQVYDPAAKDFWIVAQRSGQTFLPAQKSREFGVSLVNTLFAKGILKIVDVPELQPLKQELGAMRSIQTKNKSKDDFVDALRYCVMSVPWDYGYFKEEKKKEDTKKTLSRHKNIDYDEYNDIIMAEIEEANELYGT